MQKLLGVLACALAVVACGAGTSDSVGSPRAQTPCTTDEPPPPGDGGAALFTLTVTAGGWSPSQTVGPRLVVFADRNAIERPNAVGPATGAEAPDDATTGYLPQCVIDEAIAQVNALKGTDFGDPGITDQGSDVLEYSPAAPASPMTFNVYAPGETDGLTEDELKARARFDSLVNTLLDGFVENAPPPTTPPSTSPGR